MGNDMSQLKGYYAHVCGISRPEVFLMFMSRESGENLTYIRALTEAELARMAYSAADISNNVFRSFVEADLVIEVEDESGIEYIAVEASFTADRRDSDRALRNAGFLTRFTGHPARAVVASVRNDYHVQDLVDSGAIYWNRLPDRYPDPE